MKTRIVLLFTVLLLSVYSCADYDDDEKFLRLKEQENRIDFRVYSDTPGVPIILSEFFEIHKIVRNYWEGGYVTKQDGAQITLECEDASVLLTGEIYVNGKLLLKREGYRHVKLEVDKIKRSGFKGLL